MWTHVADLRDFYGSSLGQVARRLIRNRVRELWPDVTGERVMGFGYAVPYLRPFTGEAERVIAFMPASQGVVHWPRDGDGETALTEDVEFPLPDLSIDRVLLVHALEQSEQIRVLLREVWRVLTDSGRLMVVVPNRTGVWARLESTPFGHGQPYSRAQLRELLRDNMFMPEQQSRALYVPPVRYRMALKAAPALERIGHRWCPRLGGVNVVVATKQIYAAGIPERTEPVRARRRVYAPISEPEPRVPRRSR
ncbi:MAG: methyltransferase domain-containing protein [Acetobacterales bacterium]